MRAPPYDYVPIFITLWCSFSPRVPVKKCHRPNSIAGASERGNPRLPLHGTAGSHRLEFMLQTFGTIRYHYNDLLVPRDWTHAFQSQLTVGLPLQTTAIFQTLELMRPNLGTIGYHCEEPSVPKGWNSRFPTWWPYVTIVRNCWFPEVGTHGSYPSNHWLPLQGTAGWQKVKLMLSNLGTSGYHCKELPVPRGWKTWLPTWQPLVTIVRNCRFLKVGTHGYQPGNQRLPLQGTARCQNWNSWFPTLEPWVTNARNGWFPKVGTHGSVSLCVAYWAGSRTLCFA